ncbi:hypothetical protein BAU15_07420 [Enterococcus sp. JM4C]|nr:hypothetical protein BAU15_07420 [Enterococcus sp. JM4C]
MKQHLVVKRYGVLILLIALTVVGILFSQPTSVPVLVPSPQPKLASQKILDVPLESQFTEVALENGCEVTALSMLLRYFDYSVDKNSLADQLSYVPVMVDSVYHGNPHDGFVGNITGGLAAMGVAVEPIATLAKKIVGTEKEVISGSDINFSEIEKELKTGNPVWVITTLDFQIPTANDWLTWQTRSGTIDVCRLCHAVIVTGITDKYVYVNDPYGYKNRKVAIKKFRKAYEVMGKQMLYLR